MRAVESLDAFACPDGLGCAMCHASSILPLGPDRVLCAFFGGSFEGNTDTAIYLSLLDAGEGRCLWSGKVAASDEAHWNPVLFRCADQSLVLIFKAGNVIASWRSFIMRSADGGEHWSDPVELVPGDRGGRGPVRNKPVRLKNGWIACGGSLEEGEWRAFCDLTKDEFKTLRRSAEIYCDRKLLEQTRQDTEHNIAVSLQSYSGKGVIQPTLWEDESGLHMLLRSTVGSVLRSDSRDHGLTWSDTYRVAMPNNNSGLDVERLDGVLYLACNPVAANWGQRSPLTLFSSADGLKFEKILDLEDEPGEFSYPCVRAGVDAQGGNSLYISYTWNRENIRVRRFSLSRE